MSELIPYYENEFVTLYHGDCLEIMPKLNLTFDMCLTDPPYGTTACKWDNVIPFEPMWKELNRLIKTNGMICLFGSQPFSSLLLTGNLKMFKHEWIWIKNRGGNFANTVREPFKEHEHILCFSNGHWTYNKQMQFRTGGGNDRANYMVNFTSHSDNYRNFKAKNKNVLDKMRVPSSWQKFNTETGFHPTQKPISLLEYLIKTYTNENESLLDFTCGSGSTLIAGLETGRRVVGIETDEHYCEVTKQRIISWLKDKDKPKQETFQF